MEQQKPPEVHGCLPGLLRLAALKLLGILLLKASFVISLVLLVGGSLLLGFEPPDWMGCLMIPLGVVIFFALLFGVMKIKDLIWPGPKKDKE
jgi:protein-S-isoprenylcysteine O-methyltransferase Ste14